MLESEQARPRAGGGTNLDRILAVYLSEPLHLAQATRVSTVPKTRRKAGEPQNKRGEKAPCSQPGAAFSSASAAGRLHLSRFLPLQLTLPFPLSLGSPFRSKPCSQDEPAL